MSDKLRVLAVFSNPPSLPHLRLDREDKLFANLAKRFASTVTIERSHASEIEDIHKLLWEKPFDIVHFSGHGDAGGLYLDRSDLANDGELVSPDRLLHLMAIAEKPPKLTVFLACYAAEALPTLSQVSPFVLSAIGAINDSLCIEFARHFYERHFAGIGVPSAWEQARNALRSQGFTDLPFRLDRRQLINKGSSKFIECRPSARHNGILVNLDAVVWQLDSLGMPQDELLYLLDKKLIIHYWIFSVPRERCIIPIGRMLFGEFTWRNADDVITCTRLLRLDPTSPREQWEIWHRLLVSYNDLASSAYRTLDQPASAANCAVLARAVAEFRRHVDRYVVPAMKTIEQLNFASLVLNLQFMRTHCEAAEDQLQQEDYARVVQSLEQALTNYHETIEGLTPPEIPAKA